MLLRLPELAAAPERVTAFVPAFREVGRLSGASAIQAALLLNSAESTELAAELFAQDVERQVRAYATRHHWTHYEALMFLARSRPSAALRILRTTRPRGLRSWSQEVSAERLVCAAAALETLHRPAQARELYALGVKALGSKEVKRHARQRIKDLNRGAAANVQSPAAAVKRRR